MTLDEFLERHAQQLAALGLPANLSRTLWEKLNSEASSACSPNDVPVMTTTVNILRCSERCSAPARILAKKKTNERLCPSTFILEMPGVRRRGIIQCRAVRERGAKGRPRGGGAARRRL